MWRKVPIGIDADTLDIRAIAVTTDAIGDAPVLPDLLAQIPADEQIGRVDGDGAYDTKKCHAAIAERDVEAIIPVGDDLGHCVGAVFGCADSTITLGMHRSFGQGAFSQRDASLLAQLMPHVRRLYECRLQLSAANRRALLAEQSLDHLGSAIIVTDDRGRPLLLNKAAETALGNGLNLGRAFLVASDSFANARLGAALHRAAGAGEGTGSALLVPRERGSPLRLIVQPIRVAGRTRALILIDDPDLGNASLETQLIALHALTVAEAATVAELSLGLSPGEIADRRGVTIATVRTQVQQAMRKTGARRSADLVRIATTLPKTR